MVRLWETGYTGGGEELIAPDYVGHVVAGDRDRDGLKARISELRSVYPDIVFTVEDQMVEADKPATRLTARGTHARTSERIKLIGLNISRFADGKVVEEWAV